MKKVIYSVGGLIGALALISFVVYQFFPGTVLTMVQSSAARSAGLTERSIDLDGYTAHYFEGGPETGEVIVLLHGLIDNKHSFVPSAGALTDTHRVILPDLQGHGDNAQSPDRDYSIKGQVDFVADLLKALDVETYTIGGNSMGGHTAMALAYHYPAEIRGLIVLNATGLLLDRPPTYYEYPETIDVAYVEAMYARFLLNPPNIPGPVMRYLANDLSGKAPFYNTVVDQILNGEDFQLDDRLEDIRMPVFLLWGAHDPLLPILYAEGFHARFPNSRLQLVEAGHSPQLEIPETVGREIDMFVTQSSNSGQPN